MNPSLAEYGTKFQCFRCGEFKKPEEFGALESFHGMSVAVCNECHEKEKGGQL